MYKLLLCWRYLRTRYIALASIISVTLGVATMIVVNSVMEGFSREMQSRIHGILSDVVFESHNMEGFYDADAHMKRIQEVAGEYIAGMTPTVVVPGLLRFDVQGQGHTRQVTYIGVDEKTHGTVSDFNRYLQHPQNREGLSFELRENGYDTIDHQQTATSQPRQRMEIAGWTYRRMKARFQKEVRAQEAATEEPATNPEGTAPTEAPESGGADAPPVDPPPMDTPLAAAPSSLPDCDETADAPPAQIEHDGWTYERVERVAATSEAASPTTEGPAPPGMADNLFKKYDAPEQVFDPGLKTRTGMVLGIALASYRTPDGSDQFFLLPGDDVKMMIPTAGTPPKAISSDFTVVDFYESKMSEYDSNFVFVPIRELQRMRGMIDPQSDVGFVNSIQIKLRSESDGDTVRDLLRREFPAQFYGVHTWRDKQGPLLAAVNLEIVILNILLFLIVTVAGFGILAIFFMIVVEKTRDIGILKSLGAPNGGIMGIFLAYGLALGIVGSGAGMVIGLLFVANINRIADGVGWLTGHQVFDPSIYYFMEIPTIIEPFTITWIVFGAILIAVMASILPARRAARLHPVEALRQ